MGALAFAGRKFSDATPHGMRGFRSHGGTALAVAGRSLSSEASSPGSIVLCRERFAGRGVDTPASCVRIDAFAKGTAPAFDWALALRYGSDLLTLRLLFASQWGDAVCRAAPIKNAYKLCRAWSLSGFTALLRASCWTGSLLAGSSRLERCTRAGATVAAKTLWGHSISWKAETTSQPDSTHTRFLVSRLVAQLLIS